MPPTESSLTESSEEPRRETIILPILQMRKQPRSDTVTCSHMESVSQPWLQWDDAGGRCDFLPSSLLSLIFLSFSYLAPTWKGVCVETEVLLKACIKVTPWEVNTVPAIESVEGRGPQTQDSNPRRAHCPMRSTQAI